MFDYIKLLWWVFVDHKIQPEFLPTAEGILLYSLSNNLFLADKIQRDAILSGTKLTGFLIFFPLFLAGLFHPFYKLFTISFLIGFLICISFEKMNTNENPGKLAVGYFMIVSCFATISTYSIEFEEF